MVHHLAFVLELLKLLSLQLHAFHFFAKLAKVELIVDVTVFKYHFIFIRLVLFAD